MKLVPLEDRVVVKVMEQEEKTAAVSSFPTRPKRSRPRGGHGGRSRQILDDKGELIPMPVKEGDIVVFAKYAGTELKLDGEEYLVLRASDLIGILPEG